MVLMVICGRYVPFILLLLDVSSVLLTNLRSPICLESSFAPRNATPVYSLSGFPEQLVCRLVFRNDLSKSLSNQNNPSGPGLWTPRSPLKSSWHYRLHQS